MKEKYLGHGRVKPTDSWIFLIGKKDVFNDYHIKNNKHLITGISLQCVA